MELTTAQKQLIVDARKRSDFAVNFYGIRHTTISKLKTAGIVETVSALTDLETVQLKSEIIALCADLAVLMNDSPMDKYKTQKAGREINNKTNRLFSTKDVLTTTWRQA